MNRIEATKRVMRSIATLKDRPSFILNDQGAASIVVCLPNEYASEAMARVDAISGPVNLIIASAKYFELVTFSRDLSEGGEPMMINRDLSMGMLLLKMRAHPKDSFRLQFHEAAAPVDIPPVAPALAYA